MNPRHLGREYLSQSSSAHIVFGPQGAGKTTYARALAENIGAVRFSIDEWMIELFGADLPRSMSLSWVLARVERCESRIWSLASQILSLGGKVVLDLGFMRVSDRTRFIDLARLGGISTQLHYITAPYALRRGRVLSRNAERGETFAFEVSPAIFDFMDKKFESPTEVELAGAVISASQ